MKKILNTPDSFVQDTMEGIALAHPDKVALLDDDFRVLVSKYPTSEGKVGIVTGGGSGHLPLFLGYVGEGMLDGCAVGEVFASPSAEKMAEMIRACDRGAGVVCLFGNYNGDLFNFRMAMEDVEFDDIETRAVVVGDDVASSPAESADKRRGVAGIVYAYKVAGAAAIEGRDLDAVVEVTRKALDNIRTMGVALTPTIVPKVGKPGFTIADDEIEIGMGIHGEAGIEVRKMMRADEIAELIVGTIERDMPLTSGDRVSVLINGLGGTPLEEQYIVYRAVHRLLLEQDVHVVMPHIGEFATSMEMAGLSVTLFKLDDELETLLRAPARTPFYTNLNK
ncbi:dihydroxyacetone kinase subunit DhaK [Trueperella pyogenes]|uniref:dihydroxyacetone kinase subunit DhaK n=1 Tax=Trueperella pyogenes TaxID=1661 RepID=UPI001432B01E|nr:dihydroxyacetone kinase subunit DhaK [Trueperella pyogenes]QIU87117.1 dihydroxyacetone kinase subunit DhaK [Trueperella pyogenes]WHU60270.1 dihydroxyacetone kinase subunit DhaK [Trueperella pyogenes]